MPTSPSILTKLVKIVKNPKSKAFIINMIRTIEEGKEVSDKQWDVVYSIYKQYEIFFKSEK